MADDGRDLHTLAGIRRAIQRAENAGDPEPIIALLADDAVVLVPDFPVQEGKTACADFLRNLLPGLLAHFDRRIAYDSAEVRILGDVAIDRGTFAFTVRPKAGGEAERVTGKYLWMYERDATGAWKCARLAVSRDEEQSPSQPEPRTTSHRLAVGLGALLCIAAIGFVARLFSFGRRANDDASDRS